MKKNILLVEDEPLLRELLVNYLAQCGIEHDLVVCAHCDDAIDSIKQRGKPFDLVITDLDCPRQYGGAEVSHEAQLHSDRTQVIVISGRIHSDQEMIEMRCNAHEYLAKPFNFARFRKTIGHCIDLSEAKRN